MYQSKLGGYYCAVVVAVAGYIGRYDWVARVIGRGLHVTPDTPLRCPKKKKSIYRLIYCLILHRVGGLGVSCPQEQV